MARLGAPDAGMRLDMLLTRIAPFQPRDQERWLRRRTIVRWVAAGVGTIISAAVFLGLVYGGIWLLANPPASPWLVIAAVPVVCGLVLLAARLYDWLLR